MEKEVLKSMLIGILTFSAIFIMAFLAFIEFYELHVNAFYKTMGVLLIIGFNIRLWYRIYNDE